MSTLLIGLILVCGRLGSGSQPGSLRETLKGAVSPLVIFLPQGDAAQVPGSDIAGFTLQETGQ